MQRYGNDGVGQEVCAACAVVQQCCIEIHALLSAGMRQHTSLAAASPLGCRVGRKGTRQPGLMEAGPPAVSHCMLRELHGSHL